MDNSDNEIGYGKPPKNSQFKPGESGNKKGRPKGSKNTFTLLNEILKQNIRIKENGVDLKISKKTAMLMQLVNKGVKGDTKAITALLPYVLMADAKEEDKNKILSAMSQDDKEIISNYLKDLSNFDGTEEVNENESN